MWQARSHLQLKSRSFSCSILADSRQNAVLVFCNGKNAPIMGLEEQQRSEDCQGPYCDVAVDVTAQPTNEQLSLSSGLIWPLLSPRV